MFLFALVLGCNESSPPLEGTLNVLTYNIHGLPSEVTGDDTQGRIEMIAPLLNAYDIIGIQEDWMDENHVILDDTLDKPVKRRFDDISRGVYGSGLSFFSMGRAVEDSDFHYENCYGSLDNSSDCLASKGVQITRIEIESGVEIDFYNTHLEAGGGTEDAAVRQSQINEVIGHLQRWSTTRAVVFTGDFNLHASDSADAPLLEQLLVEGGLRDACNEIECIENEHIDRIFIRDGEDITLKVADWSRETQFVDSAGSALSDHPAIASRIDYKLHQ